MPKKYKVYRNFSGGLNSKTNPKDIDDTELVEARGVTVDRKGLIRTAQPSGSGGGSPKISGITDHSATIPPGRGLFSFKSDYSWGAAADTIAARESEYICIGDKANGEVDLYGYDDDSNTHELNSGVIDLGSNSTTQFEFYYADGALRISDASFSVSSTTKWFGRIGPDKKLLGVSITEQWLSLSNDLRKPTVGFVSPSLSGTANAAASSATVLAHPSTAAATGSITAWASTSGRATATSSSHGRSVGDVITITNAGMYNGTHTVYSITDSNTFVLADLIFGIDTGSGTWTKKEISENFQGWSTQHDDSDANPVTQAASDSRWLIAYDTDASDPWKITNVTTADQSLTTTTNSVAVWDNRAFEIYPYPGDGILLEAYQSEGSEEGAWESGEYEFAQSFVYEGNQESKLEKLNGDNITIDALQTLYVKAHVSGINNASENATLINQRLIGGRVYTRKAGTNNFWSLLLDMDFRTGSAGAQGGTRLATIDNYDEWSEGTVRDASSGGDSGLGFTNTNFRGFISKQYNVKKMSIESYENLNGFSSNEYVLSFGEVAGYGYFTSVVASQRTFVANVKYIDPTTGIARVMGDAIFYTPVGKYDTFPSSYRLEIAGNDGDEFTALAYSNGVLFAFKKNSLYLIDISNPNEAAWRLISKHSGMGVISPHSVVTTDLGVSWASKSGVYLFVDNRPINLLGQKISKSEWTTSFYDTTYGPLIGWDSNSNKLLLVNSPVEASDTMMYDFETQSWTKGFSLTTAPNWEIPGGSNTNLSNMITFIGNEIEDSSNGKILSHGGILLYGDENTSGSNDCDLYKMTFTDTSHSGFIITTKDDDFALPNTNKKIYEVLIEYLADNTSDAIDIKYEINGDDVPHGSSTALVSNQVLSGNSDRDNVNLVKITPSSPIKCRSISLRISSKASLEGKVDFISIAYRYRPIIASRMATETA
tara:strand:+ start:891 stop:3710 length:2820 start_codon:yes stop_codon:yes gene_type:complete